MDEPDYASVRRSHAIAGGARRAVHKWGCDTPRACATITGHDRVREGRKGVGSCRVPGRHDIRGSPGGPDDPGPADRCVSIASLQLRAEPWPERRAREIPG